MGTATITANNGAGTTTPITVLSPYSADWKSRNVVHDLLGGGIAVSLVTPRPRSGALELLYPDEASAEQCAQLHRIATSFTLTETDTPTVSMTYTLADGGAVRVALDPDTLTLWTVTIDYQETTP